MKNLFIHLSALAFSMLSPAAFAHGPGEVCTDDHAHPPVCEEGHDHGNSAELCEDGHDHGSSAELCADGHDHSAEENSAEFEGIHVSPEIAAKIGLKISKAEGGFIQNYVTFPAEINLNRDKMATVSPRYDSVVKNIFFKLGDEVKAGDVVAKLENRDTFATYDLLAPISGEIIEKNVSIGEMVDPSTALYEIADTSSVWADISIFPKYRHSIEEMDSVIFSTRTGCSAEGDIEYISPVISEETRTFMARCELKYACDDFSPGAFVRAKIGLKAHPAAVVVPFNAVQMVDGEAVVFVPRGNNFVQQHVTVGEGGSDFVEITSGLHHGDSYVSEGAFSLKSEIITSGMDPHAGCSH